MRVFTVTRTAALVFRALVDLHALPNYEGFVEAALERD